MVDLLDEIKDDLQRERLHNIWRNYGIWVIALALAIVVGTAGKVWWNNYTQSQNEVLGGRYYEGVMLLQQGKIDDAMKQFEQFQNPESKSYAAFAGFKRAENFIQVNKTDEAIAEFKAIAANNGVDRVLRELAELLAVNLEIKNQKADSQAVNDTLAKLARPEGVWRFSALGLQANYAFAQGDKKKALEIYNELKANTQAPQFVREQAAEMVKILGAE